jgi:hypothetical protein
MSEEMPAVTRKLTSCEPSRGHNAPSALEGATVAGEDGGHNIDEWCAEIVRITPAAGPAAHPGRSGQAATR